MTNNLPKVSGVDEAIWRRIHLIQFPVTIPVAERDPHLSEKLKAELPGILNWALEGYRAWKVQKLNPPKQVLNATEEYRQENAGACGDGRVRYVIGEQPERHQHDAC